MNLWTAFLLGLVGSLHCVGMCGPLMLAVPAAGSSRRTFFAGTMAYHAGRLATYMVLGALFGLLGRSAAVAGFQRWTSIVLGALLLGGLLVSRRVALSAPVVRLVGRLKNAMSAVLRRRSRVSLAMLGALNGLLPCGLVYVAAAGAASTADVLDGAAYLALFGLGTVPALFAVRYSARLVGPAFRLRLQRLIPASVLVLAVLLVVRGLGLGIPYLSPNLGGAAGEEKCCPVPRTAIPELP
jgi:sulfite exporter TauE/SafE